MAEFVLNNINSRNNNMYAHMCYWAYKSRRDYFTTYVRTWGDKRWRPVVSFVNYIRVCERVCVRTVHIVRAIRHVHLILQLGKMCPSTSKRSRTECPADRSRRE